MRYYNYVNFSNNQLQQQKNLMDFYITAEFYSHKKT